MTTKICPVCHSTIPAEAPGGFCPACLLRDAEDVPLSHRPAPSMAEVAAAFPKLEVLGLLGQGGMGIVYKVRQPALDRTIALKILLPELGRDPAFAERFAREARVLGKLNHPNIVTVFEHGESGGFFYLLMEFVDGVNLRQAMRAGRFTPVQALAIVPGICDALQAAHGQGVWHRDIRPENILLDASGGVKIADFGIARIVGDPARDFTLTRTGNALGSAIYMAPEQHEKPHDVDHRADIYSLGVVIYEMLTGELPLGRFPAPSRRAEVSARVDEIVLRTLEKERELRQQSAGEVKTDVQGAAGMAAAGDVFAKVLAGGLGLPDPERGRFRNYLLGALKHFLFNRRDAELTRKRGGGAEHLPLVSESDRSPGPPLPGIPDDVLAFDREWAFTLIARGLATLESEHAGKAAYFTTLKPWLDGGAETPQADAARALGMSENAVKVAIHRLRTRLRTRLCELIRAEVAATVNDPAKVADELRHLITVASAG